MQPKNVIAAFLLITLSAGFPPIKSAQAADTAPKSKKASAANRKTADKTASGDTAKVDEEDDGEGKNDETRSGKDRLKSKSKSNDDPKPSVTEHTVTIGGKSIRYKATAGYMVLKDFSAKTKKDSDDNKDKDKDKDKKEDKEHKPLAKMFYIAYTRTDVPDSRKRPVTYSFNGGPGSASIWLHMGGLGPRRAVLTDAGEALPPPYRLEDNAYSWLDETDLVFIDPVSTGYSRTEPGEDPKKFHGYNEDIESVGEFIRLYTTKNERWMSPKFIVGESYGTTRAAGLSEFLQSRYGLYLNGIVLVSAVLNFATLDLSAGNDMAFSLFMPGYTASAWYHRRLAPDLQNKPLLEVLRQAEEFAGKDYLQALFLGDRIGTDEKHSTANKLASLIGLPPGYVEQLNNRIPDDIFFTHLLMDRNQQIGRFDSRYTGLRFNPGRDVFDFDPSFEAVNGPFTATFNDYVRRDLKFESELPYETLAKVWPWSFKNAENRYLNVADDLRKAMIKNPYLKIWICCGYYDLATPYYAAKYTVDQMTLDQSIQKNIKLTYYDSGHMMYVTKPALRQLKSDFQTFVKDAVLPDSSAVPSTDR